MANYTRIAAELRFFAKVTKTDTCWLWKAHKSPTGYGRFKLPGTEGAVVQAHRWSYEHHHGPVPDGNVVMHTCDVRNCVNPTHLRTGTQGDNLKDMRDKGRHVGNPEGVREWMRTNAPKLTYELAEELRAEYAKGGISQRELGERYGVSREHARDIIARKRWGAPPAS
ncbi:HNH endonuclease signature motif containing protein [Streptomyces sp. H27-H5]|uniref:HNH endonuclease signature motif containing protein n=1 Tax=Streptomyces sp. H27-H5 TaxID=2996460 RepID=UPI0022708B56|nr:HNH endonuclease [Streptomyces sp. H27-H5]MCY0962603.1 HNH endonuclease [Streptomyces sp. H27-H5]